MSAKETPRQKMIGMMYLFLTAMLAINVSSEVLDAFTIIDSGISKTVNTFNEKNKKIYSALEEAYDLNPNKVGKALEKSHIVRQQADSLFNYLQEIKWILVRKVDGEEADVSNIKSKDNLDVPGEVMLIKGKGKKLRNQIVSYREYLCSLVKEQDSTLRKTIMESLETPAPKKQDGATRTWESHLFSHIPLVGAVTLLSKIQSDVRNTESDVINYLYNQIEAESYKFNKLNAEVIAKSSYILRGDEYEAEIFLAAQDTTLDPVIYLDNGRKITKFREGKGIYKIKPGDVGRKTWGGVIRYKTPSGQEKTYKFSNEYVVAEPNVVISPTKMNVFYVGVDNPVSISVPGIASDRIRATMSNGKITPHGKDFVVRPTVVGRDAKITVLAKFNNSFKPLKTVNFRVKAVPDPIASVGGLSGGNIKKNLLLVQGGVDAEMKDFDFDLKFKITGFTISTIVKGFTQDKTSRSDSFTNDQIQLLKKLRRKQKVYIEDIRAVGPDGITRKLPTISFRIE